MVAIARMFLLLFVFAIPWEYSLDLGEPFGNVARIAGILLLLAVIPTLLQTGRWRKLGATGWVTLAYYLWFCLSYFWTIDSAATLYRLRANFQELMIVWLLWQLADTPDDLRNLLRAFLAGSWVLALLTLAEFRSMEVIATDQIRFAAYGQDPNDLARFLDLGIPFAALLLQSERHWTARVAASGYLIVGPVAVVLTASRGGTVAAAIACVGSIVLLVAGRPRRLLAFALGLLPIALALWFLIPSGTLDRLMTIPEQLHGGDLNQRVNIWSAGWHAFVHSPLLGYGAGSFVAAAQLAPIDTAHNTALSLVVGGGLCALFLALLLVVLAARSAYKTHAQLRIALCTSLLVWAIASLTATVEENRTTWFLLAIIALAGRLAHENPHALAESFANPSGFARSRSHHLVPQPE